ncbi:hypothetical protein QWY93_04700 [Echinicola jeungdonensis]|uniref:MerC mercury resistance protein n=1 Tax=Echinicola jeungdonensis TaxID=709343 RepID=A0ABV5J532_9BACT|nr:hypothetical protein [Echinicola jeungdonensis]MDN3668623.1 hypothetical protein [Echinicola jeungdonensis]
MKERLNTSLQSISLFGVVGLTAWSVFYGNLPTKELLTYLIIFVLLVEVFSLILISKIYPESHTSFKIGMMAALLVLLGIKRVMPDFFTPLTVTAFVINFFYNFYTNQKRRTGRFKRKPKKKIKF